MTVSEVAELLRRIDQEYQAAQWGLSGLASGTARHDFINKKLENVQEAHEALVKLVGADEAIALVAKVAGFPEA